MNSSQQNQNSPFKDGGQKMVTRPIGVKMGQNKYVFPPLEASEMHNVIQNTDLRVLPLLFHHRYLKIRTGKTHCTKSTLTNRRYLNSWKMSSRTSRLNEKCQALSSTSALLWKWRPVTMIPALTHTARKKQAFFCQFGVIVSFKRCPNFQLFHTKGIDTWNELKTRSPG